MKRFRAASRWLWPILAMAAFVVPPVLMAGNQVMGELEFEGKSKVEKTSGVWIDGQYVGYLKELKGNKKVLLLPGEHSISVRQNGYEDFAQNITVRAGETQVIRVVMQKAATGAYPAQWASVKIIVNPSRAAVFLDGRFIGHVGEFEGMGRALLVAPGPHQIKIALPGYKTFETQISPLAKQKVELKTDLFKDSVPVGDPSLKVAQEPSQQIVAPTQSQPFAPPPQSQQVAAPPQSQQVAVPPPSPQGAAPTPNQRVVAPAQGQQAGSPPQKSGTAVTPLNVSGPLDDKGPPPPPDPSPQR